MSVFISDVDTAKIYVQFFYWYEKDWVVAYESLKTKEKSSWVIPKMVAVAYGSGCLQELLITKFKPQFKRGFTKVVVTRAGRLWEWSQGELRL